MSAWMKGGVGKETREPGCPCGQANYSWAKGTWLALMLCCHCLEILPKFSTNGSTFLLCTESPELCSWSWRGKLKTGCDPFSVWCV